MAGGSLSPGLAAMNDIAAATGPFAKAAGLLEDLAGISLTVKRVERAAEASGAAQAAAVRERSALITGRRLVPLPPSPLADMLYGAIDGTGVTITAKETAGRDGKGEDGRAAPARSSSPCSSPRTNWTMTATRCETGTPAATSPPSSRPRVRRHGEGRRHPPRRGPRPAADHLGDGAAWIWGIATDKFPEATQIVDLFHAREHLNDLARSLEFMLGDRKDQWLAARMEDLDHGDIDGICRAARVFPLTGVKKDELDTALGYFEHNAHRMRYRWFRSRGLFVGSGVVESGCKAVIGQRLKLSGMRWTITGADAIATLRCQQASRPEDRIWPARHNQTVPA